MYRKIVWCYVFILTLLDISLNTKLSAQGKSHGVTVHDSLIEGITFQEWGKESVSDRGAGSGRAMSAGALSLSPPALEFGRAALAAAHALTVTLTNTANTTMHLASVAGTTPDFHASFFEAKTLPPQANTTFSVVYLGRREGPVSAHLYIHTSLGVHKYPVSAVGVANEWGVWPLVGVRVPLNATVEPLLTMYNPTDQPIQVTEVYSSGAWLGLQLPDGGSVAPKDAWTVPARGSRPLVRLRLSAGGTAPLTAYVRIKANIPGGGLVVCVEARPAPPGEYASPLQLRLRTRGSQDPADTVDVWAGNSAGAAVALDASVWAARCGPEPPASPPPPHTQPPTHNGETKGTANGNGVKSEGVYVSLVRSHLEPHQQLTRAAQLTFDYAKMWAGRGGAGAWCGGWVAVGRAALPYSVRLLPGTLRLLPDTLHFVTANREEALSARSVLVRNEFPVPVHVARVDYPPDVDKYFEVESKCPLVVSAGASAAVAGVRLRAGALAAGARLHLTLRTNVSDYALPLLLYSGHFDIEWEWPNSEDGTLRLGAVGASSTRRVRATLHNRGVATLCIADVQAHLPGAHLTLEGGGWRRCVAGGGALAAQLTAVAPARAGAVRGHVAVTCAAPAATLTAPVQLTAVLGRLHALPLHFDDVAPYTWSTAPLILESTMSLSMRVVDVTLPPDNPALSYEPAADEALHEVSVGRNTVGTVVYAAEKLCEPHCYTGLDINTPEGALWERRASSPEGGALEADAALQRARHALYSGAARAANVSLSAHTSRVVAVRAAGAALYVWPRLLPAAPAAGAAGLAGVGGAASLRLRARNPSRSHSLLLQPVISATKLALAGMSDAPACRTESCTESESAFKLVEWRAVGGAASAWSAPERTERNTSRALPLLLLAPDAEIELKLSFAPQEPTLLTSYLYLRNNLTILEGLQLSGRGAYPSFEIGGRRPGTDIPLVFEVSECAGGAGTVSRRVWARNTGLVRVVLRDWRVAGAACEARGFRLEPCAPLALAPNQSAPLTLAFTADWTLARARATLHLRSDLGLHAFRLRGAAPARLLPRCARQAPRPAWEPALRAAGTLLALAALALVLAAAALDAERELRRARAARPPPAPRQPLDLRALAHQPQPPPVVVPRRAPTRRRRATRAPPDPAAERRAFERWRQDVLARPDDDDDRSSEDNEPAPPPAPAHADSAPLLDHEATEPSDDPPATNDPYDADPETEERRPGSGDEDAASTGSGSGSGSGSASASSSSPTADVDEPDDGDDRDCSPPRDRHADGPPRGDDSPPPPPRPPADVAPRPARQRRDNGETPRRGDRSKAFEGGEGSARARGSAGKHHARKDKGGKRRERPPASPPRSPPRAPPSLRWGASWSSVVAARAGAAPPPAPLAPIGSDVRRRTEHKPPTNSLFYYSSDPTRTPPLDPDYPWRPPPPVERPAFSPARDFLDEPTGIGNGSYRAMNSVWGAAPEPRGAAAAWLWGGAGAFGAEGAVRPPPGFGAPARSSLPAYDPFHSLAHIWAPGGLDWRADSPPPPAEEGGAGK